MLKDVNLSNIKTINSLRDELYTQFGNEFIDNDSEFDIGYFSGTKRIWIRNNDDLNDLTQLMRTKSVMLWCNGRKKRGRKNLSESSDSEEDCSSSRTKKKKKSACEERTDRVDDVVDELRAKHKTLFTNLQYRVGRNYCRW